MIKTHIRQKGISEGVKTDSFYLFFTPPGRSRQSISLKTSNEEIAKRKAAKLIAELEEDYSGLPGHSPTLRKASTRAIAEHLEDFLKEKQRARRDDEYLSTFRKRVLKVCFECGWKRLRDVQPDEFSDWLNGQTLCGKTLNDYLAAFNVFFKWLKRRGRIVSNPFESVERIDTRGERTRPYRAYSKEELERLFSVFPPKLKCAAYLSLYAGLRRNEVAQLDWSDIGLSGDDPVVNVKARISKNRKDGIVPLRREVVDALMAYRPEAERKGPIGLKLPKFERLRKYWVAAGIQLENEAGERATFHSLRISLGTLMAAVGVPDRVAESVCRHSRGMTYGRYVDPNYLPKRKAVECLPSIGTGAWAQKKAQKDGVSCLGLALSDDAASEDGDSQVVDNGNVWLAMSRSGGGTKNGAPTRTRT